MSERIAKLKHDIETTYKCAAIHAGSDLIVESFRDEIVWDGVVETFILEGHPTAKHCYAWSYVQDHETKYTTVLEIPPVESPKSAVRAAILAKANQQR